MGTVQRSPILCRVLPAPVSVTSVLLAVTLTGLLCLTSCTACSSKPKEAKQQTSASSANSQTEASRAPASAEPPAPSETSPPPPPPPTPALPEANPPDNLYGGGGGHPSKKTRKSAGGGNYVGGLSGSAGAHAGSNSARGNTNPSASADYEPSSPKTANSPPQSNYAVVRVFYATDRQATGNLSPASFYGPDRQLDETLHFGTVDVSIPRDHRMGRIERPVVWKLEFHPDPQKHVVLMSVSPRSEEEFYSDLANKVQSSANKDAFVFVHGFDNTFEQAALRTAQLAYDLGFQGAPIMYSWPSKGQLAEYAADEATVDWATPHLERFLENLASRSQATTVHLIAHSMGNRALTRALAGIAQKHAGLPPTFRHVFLAAPDIDVGVFRQLAATFPAVATDVTLYASARDEAIIASERIHQFSRVGDSTHICVVPKIDTIDATLVDTGLIGHAYFGDKRSILSDIFEVIQTGSPPDRRFGMHPAIFQKMTYWILRP